MFLDVQGDAASGGTFVLLVVLFILLFVLVVVGFIDTVDMVLSFLLLLLEQAVVVQLEGNRSERVVSRN